jgi:hypothetical protein
MGGPQGSNEQTELVDDDVDDLRGIRRTEKLKLFFETGEVIASSQNSKPPVGVRSACPPAISRQPYKAGDCFIFV